jgi:peptidoglycan hydrolase-like protein with peptidoglycan-binding domain
VQNYDPDAVVALVWPAAAGKPPEIPVEDRPMLENGDSGPDVVDLQRLLPRFTGDIDGDFGDITEEAVTRYQETRGLEVDGVVGQETWQALYDNQPPLPPPAPPPGGLTLEEQADIIKIVDDSWIADYDWEDRGRAPDGYTHGMAIAFAQTYKKLKAGHPAAVEMAKARTESSKDVFNEYMDEFRQAGMSNEKDGIDTLRHLYSLMLGSGIRESSGMYCCGRDQSAENVSSDTAEAGLFQTSYNASNASDPEFDMLQDEYARGASPGYREIFAEGVTCSSSDWENYGSGRGEQFQELCKTQPAFAVETHALTLRNLCNHYGPVVRHEIELKREADQMFKDVQDYMDGREAVA